MVFNCHFTSIIFLTARYPHPPMIKDGPKNMTLVVGEEASFKCVVVSDSQPYIQWLKHYQVNGSYNNSDGEPNIRVQIIISKISMKCMKDVCMKVMNVIISMSYIKVYQKRT